MKKLKWLLIIGILSISFKLVFGTVRQSPVHNFPVPMLAITVKKHSDEAISYRFIGTHRSYIKQIESNGWKEIDRLGAKQIFEENGKKVAVINTRDGFSISVE